MVKRVAPKVYSALPWSDENFLKLNSVNDCTTL